MNEVVATPGEETAVRKSKSEFSSRFLFWLTPNKHCHHCCIWCEFFKLCSEEHCHPVLDLRKASNIDTAKV